MASLSSISPHASPISSLSRRNASSQFCQLFAPSSRSQSTRIVIFPQDITLVGSPQNPTKGPTLGAASLPSTRLILPITLTTNTPTTMVIPPHRIPIHPTNTTSSSNHTKDPASVAITSPQQGSVYRLEGDPAMASLDHAGVSSTYQVGCNSIQTRPQWKAPMEDQGREEKQARV